ncbi:MAG: dephospho-CoA kinase [Bacteroidales bacterium]|nr:dephospho-CoA kinase [Bacteroidales bacterium]
MKRTVIACTGGIGSGKSAIVSAFAALGIPSYDCDSRTKALYRTDKALAARVAELLGNDVKAPDGTLDTKKMAARIFGDDALLAQLEAIVHPAVAEDFRRWAEQQESDIVIMESAILQQKPFFDNFADCTITVSAPQEVRIQRVMRRDGVSREQVEKRLAAQWTDEQREARADMVLTTDDCTALLPKILELIEKLRNK